MHATALAVGIITDITDRLDDLAASWWFLLAIFAIALLDSMVPVVPSETSVIIGAVTVTIGEAPYSLWMVILAGATGAFIGDTSAYGIGRRWSTWFHRRAESRPRTARQLLWASDQLRARGGALLITARFIPGGRTALTVSSGITQQPKAWFVKWVAIAVALWATYSAGLAYIVGKPFRDDHTVAFWVAFGTALGVNVLIEIVRLVAKRRATTD